MKIRISTPQATFTVSGTISRPPLLPIHRDSEHTMRAQEFEAEISLSPVHGTPGTVRWDIHTLTVSGRRVVGRRTTNARAHRSFYYPLQFHEGVPDWVSALARKILPTQAPPAVTCGDFSIPDEPQHHP